MRYFIYLLQGIYTTDRNRVPNQGWVPNEGQKSRQLRLRLPSKVLQQGSHQCSRIWHMCIKGVKFWGTVTLEQKIMTQQFMPAHIIGRMNYAGHTCLLKCVRIIYVPNTKNTSIFHMCFYRNTRTLKITH